MVSAGDACSSQELRQCVRGTAGADAAQHTNCPPPTQRHHCQRRWSSDAVFAKLLGGASSVHRRGTGPASLAAVTKQRPHAFHAAELATPLPHTQCRFGAPPRAGRWLWSLACKSWHQHAAGYSTMYGQSEPRQLTVRGHGAMTGACRTGDLYRRLPAITTVSHTSLIIVNVP